MPNCGQMCPTVDKLEERQLSTNATGHPQAKWTKTMKKVNLQFIPAIAITQNGSRT